MVTDRQPNFKIPSTDIIKSLNEQLNDPTFKSSTRILILILLAMNKKLTSVELRSFVGLGKGSLENHLVKMETSGLIMVHSVRSWGGVHQAHFLQISYHVLLLPVHPTGEGHSENV